MRYGMLCIAITITTASFAQTEERPWAIVGSFSELFLNNYKGNYKTMSEWNPAGRFSINRYLNKHVDLGVAATLGSANQNDYANQSEILTTTDLFAQYKIMRSITGSTPKFDPFIQVGGGYNFLKGTKWLEESNGTFTIRNGKWLFNPGLGFNYWFTEKKDVGIQASGLIDVLGWTRNNERDYTQVSLGIIGAISTNKDKDGDGILDKDDKCPNEAGKPELQGCPDKDNDGVADNDDKCPDESGKPELQGCPDRDNDGIVDADDKCPDEAGKSELQGCPDRDNDGIADADDKCPDQAGTQAFNGCPDTDGDGIADPDDRCPKEAGKPEFGGCPDTDGDGIADPDDRCPKEAGLAALKGCPDRDNDGVADIDDKCPDQGGEVDSKGCPIIKATEKQQLETKLNMQAKKILFETGSAVLKKESYKTLDGLIALLNTYPYAEFDIEGHTDNTGTIEGNKQLSKDRAQSVVDYFVSKGIEKDRLNAVGYGQERPIADNKTAAGRTQNRRVEIHLNQK